MAKPKKKAKSSETANKPKDEGIPTKQCILITPRIGEEVGNPESEDVFASLTTLKISSPHFDTLPWLPSPASHALGLPLKATRWPSNNSRLPNNLALGLFLNPDPEDEGFGKVQFRRMDGAVLVARMDGEDVEMKEVEMLVLYLSGLAKEVTEFVREERGEDDEDDGVRRVGRARELAGKSLSREGFREFARAYAARRV